MIRPLRRRHRLLVVGLAIVLPVLFVAGLAARTTVPTDDRRRALESQIPRPRGEGEDLAAIWTDLAIATRLWPGDGSGPDVLELAPREDPIVPDVLVLWSPERPGTGTVPDSARRLGRLAGTQVRRFALPPAATGRRGHLLLFSLARNELVATAALGG